MKLSTVTVEGSQRDGGGEASAQGIAIALNQLTASAGRTSPVLTFGNDPSEH